MDNKEQIYDEQIFHHMAEIIKVCKEHQIPFFATFQYGDSDFCSSGAKFGGHAVFDDYEAVRQCVEEVGFNVDKFMFWIMREARKTGHSSLILNELGIPCKPEKV